MVPRELIDDEQWGEAHELVERGLEQVDVVEDAAGNHKVEGARVVELVERDLPVRRTTGSLRVDGKDVVPRLREGRNDSAFAPTADLQHPQWSWSLWELGEYEFGELHAVILAWWFAVDTDLAV